LAAIPIRHDIGDHEVGPEAAQARAVVIIDAFRQVRPMPRKRSTMSKVRLSESGSLTEPGAGATVAR
jgi:hypothetical protein